MSDFPDLHDSVKRFLREGILSPEEASTPFLAGSYNLSVICEPDIVLPYISSFSESCLMYTQCVSLGGVTGPNHFTRRSGLASYLFIVTAEGEGELTYRGRTMRVREGQGFLIDCRQEHFYRSAQGKNWGYDLVHMNGAPMDSLFRLLEGREQFLFDIAPEDPVRDILSELFRLGSMVSLGAQLKTHLLLTELWAELLSSIEGMKSEALPEQMQRVCDYIQLHSREELSLERLSREIGMSKYELCRKFKKNMGQTPGEYITGVRIMNAKKLLVGTDLPIEVIAEETGFSYPNYFYKVFKEKEGMTPRQFRQNRSLF